LKEYQGSRSTISLSKSRLSRERTDWLAATTAVALTSLVNVLPVRLRIVANLFAAGTISGLAACRGVGAEEQGLELRQAPPGAVYGFASSAAIAVTLSSATNIKRLRAFYHDELITSVPPTRAAYEALIRIPICTALPEEVIFRGAVLGTLSRHQHSLLPAVVSSCLFGLWHIVPATKAIVTHTAAGSTPPGGKIAWLAGSVGLTSIAGLLLAFLRYRSGSIVAPWMAHSAANSTGYLATWFIARKTLPLENPAQDSSVLSKTRERLSAVRDHLDALDNEFELPEPPDHVLEVLRAVVRRFELGF
jgi:CAAX protease family protein